MGRHPAIDQVHPAAASRLDFKLCGYLRRLSLPERAYSDLTRLRFRCRIALSGLALTMTSSLIPGDMLCLNCHTVGVADLPACTLQEWHRHKYRWIRSCRISAEGNDECMNESTAVARRCSLAGFWLWRQRRSGGFHEQVLTAWVTGLSCSWKKGSAKIAQNWSAVLTFCMHRLELYNIKKRAAFIRSS